MEICQLTVAPPKLRQKTAIEANTLITRLHDPFLYDTYKKQELSDHTSDSPCFLQNLFFNRIGTFIVNDIRNVVNYICRLRRVSGSRRSVYNPRRTEAIFLPFYP